jgi:hypothetical protein
VAVETTLVLVRDLMFSSRISATARAQAVAVKVLREPEQLAEAPGRLLIVDLNQAGAIPSAAAWLRAAPGRRVVGFVSHVDSQTIESAREAGLEVLARSRFVELLPELLRG